MQSGIYDTFVDAYKKALEAKKKVMGDPEGQNIEIGPVVDEAQYQRIMGIISTAKDKKDGTLLTGGCSAGSKVSNIEHAPHVQPPWGRRDEFEEEKQPLNLGLEGRGRGTGCGLNSLRQC